MTDLDYKTDKIISWGFTIAWALVCLYLTRHLDNDVSVAVLLFIVGSPFALLAAFIVGLAGVAVAPIALWIARRLISRFRA